ncbi:MAG: type II toxin-antitoxin system HicB family antitoxin [Chloroflexota bacterium]
MSVLLSNIEAWAREAIQFAELETLSDGVVFARVPACPGAVATGVDQQDATERLCEVLEDWALVGVRLKDDIPVLGDVDLNTEGARRLAEHH